MNLKKEDLTLLIHNRNQSSIQLGPFHVEYVLNLKGIRIKTNSNYLFMTLLDSSIMTDSVCKSILKSGLLMFVTIIQLLRTDSQNVVK